MYGNRGEGEEGEATVRHRRGSWSSYGGGGEDGLPCGSISPVLWYKLVVIVDTGGSASHWSGCRMVDDVGGSDDG